MLKNNYGRRVPARWIFFCSDVKKQLWKESSGQMDILLPQQENMEMK
jgi:hypothetical protein